MLSVIFFYSPSYVVRERGEKMKRISSIKNRNNGIWLPVLLGAGGCLLVQILGAMATTSMILNGAFNETGMDMAAFLIRVMAVITDALLTWYTAKDSRRVCMIVSCVVVVMIWLVACLSFWDMDAGAFFTATAISSVAYGASALLLPMMGKKQKWGHVSKRYR